MAMHEFGIMPVPPQHGERFDTYRPEFYDILPVDDRYIEPIIKKLANIKMYAHTIDIPHTGLVYCGITLIPPEAAEPFIGLIDGSKELLPLKELFVKAKKSNQYVIHFGL